MINVDYLTVDESVYDYCIQYVNAHSGDKWYDNNNLAEYYPGIDDFVSNFKFCSACIGRMPTGIVSNHIDEDRSSVLIIPLTPRIITITTLENEYEFKNVLLDTTAYHGARNIKNGLFLAIDFCCTFESAQAYIESFDLLYIKARL